MRAEKRIVNAKKELVKLKEVAAKLHATSKRAPITKEAIESSFPDVQVNQEAPMQVDESNSSVVGGASKAKKSKQVINNQWMNQKKIKAIKSKIKRHNSKKARRTNSAGLKSRKAKKSIKK